MSHHNRKRKNKNLKLFFCVLVELGVIALLVFLLLLPQKVHRKVIIEAGAKKPDVSEFLKGNNKGSFLTDLSQIDSKEIGTYTIRIKVEGKTYKSKLVIEDTVAPKATDSQKIGALGFKLNALTCVKNVEDATKVTAHFEKEPNWKLSGEQKATVILKDEGQNETKVKVTIHLLKDQEPPVIQGVKDQTVTINGTISYKKGVTVTDNQDKDPDLSIDTSKVNLQKEGSYEVTYIATDQAGNKAKKKAIITVMNQTNLDDKTKEMEGLAQALLDEITTPQMDKMQIAKAIYDWCIANINYTDSSDKSSWITGAIQGMRQRSGDCYNYFATAKALLTQAGIKNVDIVRSDTSESSHFWSLVDLGEGYYHFDCTPRIGDGDYFFMVTDAQLEAYSKAHENSHVFDASLYPKRATKIITR